MLAYVPLMIVASVFLMSGNDELYVPTICVGLLTAGGRCLLAKDPHFLDASVAILMVVAAIFEARTYL